MDFFDLCGIFRQSFFVNAVLFLAMLVLSGIYLNLSINGGASALPDAPQATVAPRAESAPRAAAASKATAAPQAESAPKAKAEAAPKAEGAEKKEE